MNDEERNFLGQLSYAILKLITHMYSSRIIFIYTLKKEEMSISLVFITIHFDFGM